MSVNKLLKSLGFDAILKPDNFNLKYLYSSKNKKWLANILPVELLNRSVKEAVESIVTLSESGEFFETFPDNIQTPDYGDKWGRRANYIELNNRAIAQMHSNRCKNGILSSIKMLPAIMPSAKSWANCIVLSQIFPVIYGDGYNKPVYEENSIYGIKLNAGYSENIIDFDIAEKISPEEQIQAYNDLCHFRGIKSGFRMVISQDQIKVAHPYSEDETFQWGKYEHQELFIDECVKLMNLGFEAMFIDSAKHIGGYEMENYAGVGALPDYGQMQYILEQIRGRSGKTNISFMGEKSTGDFSRYHNLGLTTGTAFISPNNYDDVKGWAKKLKYCKEYAPGVEVSNDNDMGGSRYEDRLKKIHTALFAYEYPSDKLPSFVQTEDIFPLRYDSCTHCIMMANPSYSTDGGPVSHWENLFTKEDGRAYNAKVADMFIYALNL